MNLVILSMYGSIHYMGSSMSVYRIGVEGSWTSRMITMGLENYLNYLQRHKKMLEALAELVDDDKRILVLEEIRKMEFKILRYSGDFVSAKSPKYKDLYVRMSTKEKIKLITKYYRMKYAVKNYIFRFKSALNSSSKKAITIQDRL